MVSVPSFTRSFQIVQPGIVIVFPSPDVVTGVKELNPLLPNWPAIAISRLPRPLVASTSNVLSAALTCATVPINPIEVGVPAVQDPAYPSIAPRPVIVEILRFPPVEVTVAKT